MHLRKWMAFVVALVLAVGLVPAWGAVGEEDTGMLPKNKVLVKGEVVFNDPALQKAVESDPYYGWYASAKEYLEKAEYLDFSKTESPITDLSVLQLCGNLRDLRLTSTQLKSLAPLAYCKKLEQLVLVDCNTVDLTPLQSCKGLKILLLQGEGVTDISVVAGLKKLDRLILKNCNAPDLTPIKDCKTLSILRLEGEGVTDISAAASLKKLKMFVGIGLKGVDFTPLATAPALAEVYLTDCVGDITPLATLKKLKVLSVTGGETAGLAAVVQGAAKTLTQMQVNQQQVTDALMQSIGACGKLQNLDLVNITGTVSLAALATCKSLKAMYIDTVDTLTGAQGLAGLTKLTDITIFRVRDAVFAGLDTLPAVTNLLLYNAKVDDISFIARMPKLQYLTLGALRGADYAFMGELASAKKLKELSLYGTPLTTLDAAAKLTSLNTLRLFDTGITDITAISKLKKLKFIVLYGNPITDYRPLRALKGSTQLLGDNLNEQIIADLQAANPKGYVQAQSADVDPLYDEAVFFGEADAKPRAEREDTTAQANRAALMALEGEAQEKAEAALLKSIKKAKVASKDDLRYYANGQGGITIYGIQTKANVVRLPDTLDKLPVQTLSLSEWYVDGFDGIQTLIIPASVTQIDKLDMHNIQAFFVDEGNTAFRSQNGAVLTHDGKTLVRYPAHRTQSLYTVPDGVETIAVGAFGGQADYQVKLTVTLPTSVSRFEMEADGDAAYYQDRAMCVDRFEVSPDNATYAAVEGSLTDKQGKVLIALGNAAGVNDEATGGTVYTIPEGITTIGTNMDVKAWYNDCLAIPASLTSIQGDNTRSGWMFGTYRVASGNTVFAAVEGCLVSLDGKTLYKSGKQPGQEQVQNSMIPNGVETVLPGALLAYTQVEIPASVTSISTADLDFAQMERFTVSPGNTVYSSLGGVLFSKDGKTLICYPSGAETVDTYTVPDGVEIIGENAFTVNADADKIILPDTVREIRADAIQDWNLQEITIPASVTVIGENALPFDAHFISPEGSATWTYLRQIEETIKANGYTVTFNITAE